MATIIEDYAQTTQGQDTIVQKDDTSVVTTEIQAPGDNTAPLPESLKAFEVTESGEVHTEWTHKTRMTGSLVFAVLWGNLDADVPALRRRLDVRLWGAILGIPGAAYLDGELHYNDAGAFNGNVDVLLESFPAYAMARFTKNGNHIGTWHMFVGGLPIRGALTGDNDWKAY